MKNGVARLEVCLAALDKYLTDSYLSVKNHSFEMSVSQKGLDQGTTLKP